MATKPIDYKGQKATIIMMGTKQQVKGWQGEIYVAVIQYGEKDQKLNYDVVPDSTNAAEVDELPEVKTFDDRGQAIAHFMKLERNKDKWK
jgi:hypothetical protein